MSAARHGTLVAGGPATSVTLTDVYPDGVWVHNRSQSGAIWVRFDGIAPTVGGDDSFWVVGSRLFPNPTIGKEGMTVQLISSAALDYSVEGTVIWT